MQQPMSVPITIVDDEDDPQDPCEETAEQRQVREARLLAAWKESEELRLFAESRKKDTEYRRYTRKYELSVAKERTSGNGGKEDSDEVERVSFVDPPAKPGYTWEPLAHRDPDSVPHASARSKAKRSRKK